MVSAVWYKDTLNVGDNLTPFILSRFFNEEVTFSSSSPRWIISGSILDWSKEGDILCGVGTFDFIKPLQFHVVALAVRGPLTADKILDEPKALGDGGLLVPKVYSPPKQTGDKLGIIPHYVEYPSVKARYPNAFVINVMQSVENFLRELFQCRMVLSSSLHGIVLAEGYGIPAFRGSFGRSHNIYSFDFKHRDYYEGTGRSLPEITSIDDFLRENVDLIQKREELKKVKDTQEKLWEVFTEYAAKYKTDAKDA
ncbi:MAG: exopolysaccharide glucosyl ketal-pyruvate-transferase [Patescibacteria group bacterium]|nr:MAG: exopolysaccharide glucosyl ketal-pyruvate-transferase [Patescibacteria group bacterium]